MGTRQASCDACPAGYSQDSTQESECSACAASTYQSFKAQSSCVSCPEGFTQTSEGQTSCSGGTQAQDSSDLCDMCSVGGQGGTFQANRMLNETESCEDRLVYYGLTDGSCTPANAVLQNAATVCCCSDC